MIYPLLTDHNAMQLVILRGQGLNCPPQRTKWDTPLSIQGPHLRPLRLTGAHKPPKKNTALKDAYLIPEVLICTTLPDSITALFVSVTTEVYILRP